MQKKQVLMCIDTDTASFAIQDFVLTSPKISNGKKDFLQGEARLCDPERRTSLLLVDSDY